MVWIKYILNSTSESILALIKVITLSKFKTKIKNSSKDRDLIILGNGPSLSGLLEKNREFITNKDLICVNFFPLSRFFEVVKPSFFITSAPELWIENVDDIYSVKRKELFKALGEKTKWPLKLLIPFSARKSGDWKSYLINNSNIEIVYYNDIGIEGFQNLKFWFFKKNLAMPRPHNVLIPAIFNAINMGYKNIFLWGAENNQFLEMSVDNDNTALISQKHFYDSSNVKAKVMRKAGVGRRRVHEILHKFMLAFEGYHILREYADNKKVRIINQTPNSMIDAFERDENF